MPARDDDLGIANLPFAEELCALYLKNPELVPAGWREYFASLSVAQALQPVPGNSSLPSPLVGEGGHERSECRVRGESPPHPAFAALTSALSHKGRGNIPVQRRCNQRWIS